jgi:hypothetical protein
LTLLRFAARAHSMTTIDADALFRGRRARAAEAFV